MDNLPKTGIGTLGEKSLHAALKQWYARPGDTLETRIDSYVVDIVRDDLLIEIQTRNFTAMKSKLDALLDKHSVRLVHPIAQERWIVRLDANGKTNLSRRKSPRRGNVYHLFDELVRIPHLITHPNFTLDVLLTQEEEIRLNDGQGSWRRKGWSIYDRRLLAVVEQIPLVNTADFQALLPPDLPQPFTNKTLATALKLRPRLAQRMTYCLRQMNALEIIGKQGNALLYALH